jgi:hypothetical protein
MRYDGCIPAGRTGADEPGCCMRPSTGAFERPESVAPCLCYESVASEGLTTGSHTCEHQCRCRRTDRWPRWLCWLDAGNDGGYYRVRDPFLIIPARVRGFNIVREKRIGPLSRGSLSDMIYLTASVFETLEGLVIGSTRPRCSRVHAAGGLEYGRITSKNASRTCKCRWRFNKPTGPLSPGPRCSSRN